MADPDDLSLLPENPEADELFAAYKLCRQKLVAANRSRSSLAGHNTRRYKAIRDLQSAIKTIRFHGLRVAKFCRMEMLIQT